MNTIDIPTGTHHTTPNGTVVEAVATSDSCERCIFGDCNDPKKQHDLFRILVHRHLLRPFNEEGQAEHHHNKKL